MLRSRVIASIRRRMHGAGLPGIPDADPDVELARGRARLPRAEPHSSGEVLRAAAGAAAVQAAPDGGGLRPLLPDRAVLPRRGRARRSVARRVLPARRRDVVRHAGRRLCGRSSRCLPGCSASSRPGRSRRRRFRALPYDDAMAMYGTRQAGPAQSDASVRRHGASSATRSSRVFAQSGRRRVASCARFAAPGAADRSRSFFDKTVGLGESLGLGGLAYIVAGETPKGPLGEVPARTNAASGCSRRRVSSLATRCSSRRGRRRRLESRGRRPARAPGDASSACSKRHVSLLLGHRFSVLRARSGRPTRSRSATIRFRCRRADWRR